MTVPPGVESTVTYQAQYSKVHLTKLVRIDIGWVPAPACGATISLHRVITRTHTTATAAMDTVSCQRCMRYAA